MTKRRKNDFGSSSKVHAKHAAEGYRGSRLYIAASKERLGNGNCEGALSMMVAAYTRAGRADSEKRSISGTRGKREGRDAPLRRQLEALSRSFVSQCLKKK